VLRMFNLHYTEYFESLVNNAIIELVKIKTYLTYKFIWINDKYLHLSKSF
jgi:hypothetical protein